MKILYLLRHAKSSWEEGVDDHKRSLKNRGKNDAELVSKYVAIKVKAPQKIYSSDANRAQTTARYFKESFGVSDKDCILKPSLYDFEGSKVMEVIKNVANNLDCVMIVGHNHALTSIVNMLGDAVINNLPTCGFVELQFEVDSWEFANFGHTSTQVFPRDLKPKEN